MPCVCPRYVCKQLSDTFVSHLLLVEGHDGHVLDCDRRRRVLSQVINLHPSCCALLDECWRHSGLACVASARVHGCNERVIQARKKEGNY